MKNLTLSILVLTVLPCAVAVLPNGQSHSDVMAEKSDLAKYRQCYRVTGGKNMFKKNFCTKKVLK